MTAPLPAFAYRTSRSWLASFKTRYVRTPAGVRRYGVPIGSPIPIGRRVRRRNQPDPSQRPLPIERTMTDEALSSEMVDALARDDIESFERFAKESDRREKRRAQDRARREEARAHEEERRAAAYEEAIAAGVDDEQAVADIYGVPVSKQRRQRAMDELRANGYHGRGFEEMARASFRDHVYAEILRAEDSDEVGGYMVSREGMNAGIDGRSLFTGSEARAYRWASDELKEWWETHPRPNFADYRESLLGGA